MRARTLLNNCDGAVLPFVAIILVVVLALSALAIDGGRLMSVQTQLQNAADAFALAGAAELDRRPDSITRARAAIYNLISNPIAGAGNQVAKVTAIDFLWSLPASDDLPVTNGNLTNDPTRAGYVQVTVEPITLPLLFPVSVLGERRITVGARAIGGYDQIVCNITPLYVCNPFEMPGMTYYQASQALVQADQNADSKRRLIRLAGTQFDDGRNQAGGIGYMAPATGFLPAHGCGPAATSGVPQALAASRVRACFRLSSVNLLSAPNHSATDGLNTRFDIYANGFSSCHIYAPDQNVRKGFTTQGNADWCNATSSGPEWPMPDPYAAALPVDQNMIGANGAFDTNVALGNGLWDCAAYWQEAHSVGPGHNLPPTGCSAAATISRYSVYVYEMKFLGDRSLGAETGFPRCAPPGENNRRIVYAAIINCQSAPAALHADAQEVPVAAFGRFFLVLPANPGTNGNPYAEFLGLVSRSDPLSSDTVQLNR